MQLTTEQQQIVDDVQGGHHVSVTALPGSGKSRVAYELIRQCTQDQVVILIMYNRSLCDATTEHLQKLDISAERTVKAFTFHGLASSLTGTACHNDRQITYALTQPPRPHWKFEDFSLLIIDEGQDTRPGFMQLVHYLLRFACADRPRVRIVLLGDPRQLLYGFYSHNRADARFLSLGHLLLNQVNTRVWERRQLTQSFRSTQPVTKFLNAVVPGHAMVSRGTSGPPVTLDLCDLRSFEPAAKIVQIVSQYPPEEVLVLCSSLGPGSPARRLVRTLVRHGFPVHVQRSGALRDTGPVAALCRRGRIQFKTYCASKGLEAKLVVVLNSRSLFQDMENSLYVALSRSMERLVIFQDTASASLEEINTLCAKLTADDLAVVINKHSRCRPLKATPADALPPRPRKYSVATLFQYVEPELLAPIERGLQRTALKDPLFADEEDYARLFDLMTDKGQCVNVHSIVTGAIRLAVEYFRTHQLPAIVRKLERSRDPYVKRLVSRGMQVLRMRVPHIEGDWELPHLYLWLQAFAMFSTAIDAFSSFEEKIVDLSDFGFIMHPLIVQRVERLLLQMAKYIPDSFTKFSVPLSLVVGEVTICSTPTLCSGDCVFSLLHQPSTDVDDLLGLAVHVVIHDLEYGYVSNLSTGSLLQVYVPRSDHTSFLEQVVKARESCEEDLEDSDFLHRHHFRGE